MERIKAEEMARKLINHYCPQYTFRWGKSKRLFGSCNYTKKEIMLSEELSLLNNMEQVRDTILHEIAHALTKGEHHNKVWKAKCVEIGCSPARTYPDSVQQPRGKKYTCPNCHKVVTYFRKRSMVACSSCCKKYNKGKWSDRFVFIRVLEHS